MACDNVDVSMTMRSQGPWYVIALYDLRCAVVYADRTRTPGCRLNNCVGKRNYRYFLWFVFTLPVAMMYVMAFSIVHIVVVWTRHDALSGFLDVLLYCPPSYPLLDQFTVTHLPEELQSLFALTCCAVVALQSPHNSQSDRYTRTLVASTNTDNVPRHVGLEERKHKRERMSDHIAHDATRVLTLCTCARTQIKGTWNSGNPFSVGVWNFCRQFFPHTYGTYVMTEVVDVMVLADWQQSEETRNIACIEGCWSCDSLGIRRVYVDMLHGTMQN
jgi:hypothetical protein